MVTLRRSALAPESRECAAVATDQEQASVAAAIPARPLDRCHEPVLHACTRSDASDARGADDVKAQSSPGADAVPREERVAWRDRRRIASPPELKRAGEPRLDPATAEPFEPPLGTGQRGRGAAVLLGTGAQVRRRSVRDAGEPHRTRREQRD